MTTRDFIFNAFTNRKSGKCSSVFAENGEVYSYGYHYPLLFRVNGKAIRNVRGYSNTTARHLLWSRDIDAIDVHTFNHFRLTGGDDAIMQELIKAQQAWVDSRRERIAKHKEAGRRTDTRVYAEMQRDLLEAENNLYLLEN